MYVLCEPDLILGDVIPERAEVRSERNPSCRQQTGLDPASDRPCTPLRVLCELIDGHSVELPGLYFVIAGTDRVQGRSDPQQSGRTPRKVPASKGLNPEGSHGDQGILDTFRGCSANEWRQIGPDPIRHESRISSRTCLAL